MTATIRRSAAAIAAALVLGTPAVAAAQSAPFPVGVWSRGLPPDTPLLPNSANLANALAKDAATASGFSMRNWNSKIYVVPPNQPGVQIVVDEANTKPAMKLLQTAMNGGGGVPIPPGALPSSMPQGSEADTDSEIVIYQPGWSGSCGTGRVWEFWRASTPQMNALTAGNLPWGEASHRDHKWHVKWGGRISCMSTNPGHPVDRNIGPPESTRLDRASKDPTFESKDWLATATGLPLVGGMVTFDDWKRGSINHAVGLVVPRGSLANGGEVWPAQRNDGRGSGPVAEGMRFRLPADYPVDPLAPKMIQMLVEAAKLHGFIVWDGGGGVGIRFEQQQTGSPWGDCPGSTCTNAWMQPGGPLYVGNQYMQPSQMPKLFPWKDLQVVAPWNDDMLGPPSLPDPEGVVVASGATTHVPLKATSPGGYPLAFVVDRAPTRGSAVGAGDGIDYTAPKDYLGEDSLVVHATDGGLASKAVTLPVLVLPASALRDPQNAGAPGSVGPIVFGLLAKRGEGRGGKRALKLTIASYNAHKLEVKVKRGKRVVAKRRISPGKGFGTELTLQFRGRPGRYLVSVRPLGKSKKDHGKPMRRRIRL